MMVCKKKKKRDDIVNIRIYKKKSIKQLRNYNHHFFYIISDIKHVQCSKIQKSIYGSCMLDHVKVHGR